LTQIFLPLVRRAHGRVVFLTSGLNRVPSPVRGIQCATQAAVDCFAACLRQEMRTRGVDVSVVAAGEFAPGNGWLNETELREQVRTAPIFIDQKRLHSYSKSNSKTRNSGYFVLNDKAMVCGMLYVACGMGSRLVPVFTIMRQLREG